MKPLLRALDRTLLGLGYVVAVLLPPLGFAAAVYLLLVAFGVVTWLGRDSTWITPGFFAGFAAAALALGAFGLVLWPTLRGLSTVDRDSWPVLRVVLRYCGQALASIAVWRAAGLFQQSPLDAIGLFCLSLFAFAAAGSVQVVWQAPEQRRRSITARGG